MELLVVILIIGILAAVGLAAYLNQKDKANDAGAKVMARTAETVMESYAVAHNGTYAGASVAALVSIEPSILTASTSQAYLASVTPSGWNGYTVVAFSPADGDSFSVVKNGNTVQRTCSGPGGGCPAGGTW